MHKSIINFVERLIERARKNPKVLKSSINNTSRVSANLGTFMAVSYEKGMRRLELNKCIKMYRKDFKLLGLPPNLPAPILRDINELGG